MATPKSSLTPCVLDDDPAQLDALSSMIAELGYEPVPTGDPEEALKAIRYCRCRLLLADIHSPGVNGYDFLDRALRTDPTINQPIPPENRVIAHGRLRGAHASGFEFRGCRCEVRLFNPQRQTFKRHSDFAHVRSAR
jgi:hypothetical protein